MTSFVLTPAMRELVTKAQTNGGTLTPAQIQAMKSSGTVKTGGGLICDPRAFSAGCTKPSIVKTPVKVESTIPLDNGLTKTTLETETESVTAVVDKSGDVKAVEVKPLNKLIPLALLAAGALILGG